MRSSTWTVAASLVIAAALSSAAMAAANDFEVLASNVEALKVGTAFERTQKVDVPAGGQLSLIDRTGSSIRMRYCTGAYSGPIADCPGQAPSGGKSFTPGGTRGIAR
jgi:hypothetical protein